MQMELAGIGQSTEFLCPSCGTSAFEILGTQWNLDDETTDGAEFLVMRCLDCLDPFCHQITRERSHPLPLGHEQAGPGAGVPELPHC